MGVPAIAVEDALQETFLVVHRRLPEFEGRGSMRSWLFGIVRRVAFRYRRARSRAERKTTELAREPVDVLGPDDVVAQRQMSALLFAALDDLDDDKRAAITLHVFDELSGPEVAELLGIKVDTAYSRIKAARRALHRALARRGLDREAAQLVHAAQRTTTPRRTVADRVARSVALAISTAPARAAAGLGSSLGGLKLALGIGALLGTAVLGARVFSPPTPPSTSASPAPPRAFGASPATAPAGRESPRAVPPRAPRSDPPSPPPPDPGSAAASVPRSKPLPTEPRPSAKADPQARLEAEVALIAHAKDALDRDAPAAALQQLDEHQRSFPDGQLTTERRAYRAVALCQLGRTKQGRAEARIFVEGPAPRALIRTVRDGCRLSSSPP